MIDSRIIARLRFQMSACTAALAVVALLPHQSSAMTASNLSATAQPHSFSKYSLTCSMSRQSEICDVLRCLLNERQSRIQVWRRSLGRIQTKRKWLRGVVHDLYQERHREQLTIGRCALPHLYARLRKIISKDALAIDHFGHFAGLKSD